MPQHTVKLARYWNDKTRKWELLPCQNTANPVEIVNGGLIDKLLAELKKGQCETCGIVRHSECSFFQRLKGELVKSFYAAPKQTLRELRHRKLVCGNYV